MSYINPVNKPLCLQLLYEDNYAKLLKKLPLLRQEEQSSIMIHNNIRAELVERCPYTLSINLQSISDQKNLLGPAITCRLYLDTRSVEVLHVEGFMPTLNKFHGDSPRTVLDKKWVLNYFLEQWLAFGGPSPEQTKAFSYTANA